MHNTDNLYLQINFQRLGVNLSKGLCLEDSTLQIAVPKSDSFLSNHFLYIGYEY